MPEGIPQADVKLRYGLLFAFVLHIENVHDFQKN